ncbi:MAG TPA: FkbM family methyltransferase [Stellaceae bacterium]|nr:FkbM family methyltransferase [Stellaceae bacterium]
MPTRTLDSYDFAPVLLKLNVQRAEIEVLNGARATLERHRPVILSAYPWDALIRMLADLGYRTYAYRSGNFVAEKLGRRFTWFLLPEHAEQVSVVARGRDQNC